MGLHRLVPFPEPIAVAGRDPNVSGISHRKITVISTSIWAIPARSSAPIALRYSVSIRACAHANPIRRTVLTVTWSEKDGAALARFGVHSFTGAANSARSDVNKERSGIAPSPSEPLGQFEFFSLRKTGAGSPDNAVLISTSRIRITRRRPCCCSISTRMVVPAGTLT